MPENVYPPVAEYKGEKWRGECIKCRAVWFSEEEPKKCPNCGMDRNLMKDVIRK